MNNLDYGVIGNCRTAALVSKEGSIDWLCLPTFESPSVFSRILDREKGGSFAILAPGYITTQRYFVGTNILCTTFSADEGAFEVLDFMPRYRTHQGEHYMSAEVYRYLRPLRGKPHLRVRYDPVLNYGREKVLNRPFPEFIRTFSLVDSNESLYLYTSLNFDAVLHSDDIALDKDEYLLLSYNQKLIPIDTSRVYLEYQRTKVYWLNWDNRSRRFSSYNDIISRSLLILKLMSYHSSGAVVAAITTSIPETIGEVRNWDYRYCWIRDASMSIETLLKMGHQSTAKRFMLFIKNMLKSKSDSFQIMYSIDGGRVLNEEVLPHLAGYAGSRPVRIGNAAYNQRQNDSMGYLMDVIHSYYFNFPGTLDEIEEMWEIVKTIVKTVYREWRNTDCSIWEFRNKREHYVLSKVMCWVAIDRAIGIARFMGQSTYEQAWKKEADIIREDILVNGWNEALQSFTQAYGSPYMDSSLLLMERYGFIEATDERYIGTVHRVKQELLHNGLMYRYKNDDDFGAPSSAFTICTFWLVRALHVIGEEEEALAIFNELLSCSNHLGLFSEDLDFKTRRQLGNFPQAYSHLALINTALLFTNEAGGSKFIKP